MALDYLIVEYHRPLPLPTSPSTIAMAVSVVLTIAAAVGFCSPEQRGQGESVGQARASLQ